MSGRRIRTGFVLALLAALAAPLRAAQSPAPVHGGTFVFAIGSDPETLNPAITTGVEALAVDCKMFNGLTYRDREGKSHPELATDWFVTRDGLQYTFKLRRDVRWQDGQPFTSADVKFTFDDVLAKYHPRAKVAFTNVAGVETPDAYTVVVKMKKPYGPFLQQMTCQDGAILPKHIYAGTDILRNPHNADNPIGTGPFKFQSYTRGDRVTMVRNPDYFRKGLPYFDTVIAKIVPDQGARVQGLETGEIDYVQSFFLPKEQVGALQRDPKIQLKYDTDVPGNYLLFLNDTKPPLNDPRVRQALLRAINRRQILQQAFFGIGYVAKSAIHQKLWAYDPQVDLTKMYPYDPKAANAELDRLGLVRRNGTRFTFRLAYNVAQAGFASMAQIIRDDLAAVGIAVTLEPLERGVLTDVEFSKHDYEGALEAYTTGGDPAIGIAREYITTPPGIPFSNPTGYSNPKVDELFRRGALTVNLADRKKYYDEVQVLLARQLPLIPLIDRTEVDAAQADLRGLWKSGQPYDEWDQVWRSR
jgi:peptide/nickel transport system substrate-binding protein